MRFANQVFNGASYISAAQNAGGDISAALAMTAPDWGIPSKISMKNSAEEAMIGMKASADLATAGITGTNLAQQGALQGKFIKAQGEAAASATESKGLRDIFGSIGSGAIGAAQIKAAGAFKPKAAVASLTGNKLGNYGRGTFGAFQPWSNI